MLPYYTLVIHVKWSDFQPSRPQRTVHLKLSGAQWVFQHWHSEGKNAGASEHHECLLFPSQDGLRGVGSEARIVLLHGNTTWSKQWNVRYVAVRRFSVIWGSGTQVCLPSARWSRLLSDTGRLWKISRLCCFPSANPFPFYRFVPIITLTFILITRSLSSRKG
jgi:hypothetical protein